MATPVRFLIALLTGAAVAAEPLALHTFTKQQLSDAFYNEGAAVADINRDGKPDIISGPFWYEGPSFTTRHEFYPGRTLDPHGFSEQFFTFAGDIDGDGWIDLITVGIPGAPAYWWRNPQGVDKPWPRYLALDAVDNESPAFVDITGDRKPELLCLNHGRIGYAQPNPLMPEQPWTFHPISAPGKKWGRYTHGLGAGDVNGDGRSDVLLKEGWWEHPAQDTELPWVFHAADFGPGGAQMCVVDVDQDGRADVVTSLKAHGFGLAWFAQGADGGFIKHLIMGEKPEQNPYGLAFTQMHAVAVADIDGDGLPDIITGKRWWGHGPDGDPQANQPAVLYWFRQVRDGSDVRFVPYLIDDASGVGTDVVVADVNGDGQPDIVVGNKKGTFVFLHQVQMVDQATWDAAQPLLRQ